MEQIYSIRKDTHKYTLQDVKKEVDEILHLLAQAGYPEVLKQTYKIELSSRRKNNFGKCAQERGSTNFTLSFNSNYIKYASPEHVHETILHECIHSVPGCMNHGAKWKAIGEYMSTHYQFTTPTRLTHDENYNKNYLRAKTNYYTYKYAIVCDSCGKTWRYKRKSRIIDSAPKGTCTCPYCSGHKFTVKTL